MSEATAQAPDAATDSPAGDAAAQDAATVDTPNVDASGVTASAADPADVTEVAIADASAADGARVEGVTATDTAPRDEPAPDAARRAATTAAGTSTTSDAPVTARARVTPSRPPAARAPEPPLSSTPPVRRTRAVGKATVPAVAVPTVPNPRVPVDSAAPAADEHTWLDEEAGPVVRPYTLTGGRSRPFTSGLNMLTYVEALYAPDADLVGLQPEQRAILEMTRTATTVAELAARLDLPVGVVRVLVGDLIQANLVSTFEADALVRAPGDDILQAVIDGLRAL